MIAPRDQKYQSNFVEVKSRRRRQTTRTENGQILTISPVVYIRWIISHKQFRNHKLVYRRYAGLFFCFCVDANDNELIWLEAIHLFVEVLGEPSFPHPWTEALSHTRVWS